MLAGFANYSFVVVYRAAAEDAFEPIARVGGAEPVLVLGLVVKLTGDIRGGVFL